MVVCSSPLLPMTDPIALHANPLAIVRGFPTKKIPIDQVKTRDGIVIDEIFQSKYLGYLQLAAVMKEREWEKDCETTSLEQVKGGLSAYDAKQLKDAKMFGYRLASIVAEKARLFPFGLEHHRDIYSFLSDIVHHDFSMNARYTNTLEHGDDSVFCDDAASTAIYCADLFTAAIVTRILDDVGQPKDAQIIHAALAERSGT